MQVGQHPSGLQKPKFVPNAVLGRIKSDGYEPIRAKELFAKVKAFVIGIPGAYTPICSEKHVPELVRDADRLKAAGFDIVGCIASNYPFVLHHWSREIDPENRIMFLSDGNLDFASSLGLLQSETSLFLGTRSERYSLSIQNNEIIRRRVETSIFDVKCSGVANALGASDQQSDTEFELI